MTFAVKSKRKFTEVQKNAYYLGFSDGLASAKYKKHNDYVDRKLRKEGRI